ncbi:hypothetical protein EsDP_00003437 [Epichloe bromicola]|uniref:Uncharacterized protein n=1 Tax=Epichloe bromicola TaxID=79588 RepID=A0ABQ0CNT0_9HYPO
MRAPEADLLNKALERGVKGLAKVVGYQQEVASISKLRENVAFSTPYQFRGVPRSANTSSQSQPPISRSFSQFHDPSIISNFSRKRKSIDSASYVNKVSLQQSISWEKLSVLRPLANFSIMQDHARNHFTKICKSSGMPRKTNQRDGLSEKEGEYVEVSVQGKDLMKHLDYIKRNPVPDKATFRTPPSPRPTYARLSQGWHDQEVALIPASVQPPTQTPTFQGYPSTTQGQVLIMSPGLRLKAEECLEAVVVKFEDNIYKCDRLLDRRRIHVPQGEWAGCDFKAAGSLQTCFAWTGSSGATYYTWSLESERRRDKKARR